MTEKEKAELIAVIAEVVRQEISGHCSLGIKPETAHELISFADSWKTYRKGFQVAMAGVLVTGAVAALWAGIKAIFTHPGAGN